MGTGLAMTPNASTLVVGANGEDDYQGAAYVYVNRSGTWKKTGKLTASDATEDAGLGGSISISADGSTILTGAYLGGANFQGTAYVFTRSSGAWSQSAELLASDQAPISYFGMQVGLSRNGATAVISAEDHAANEGSAYVFSQSGGTWAQAAEVTGGDSVSGDQFGSSASISANGTTIAVGSISHNNGEGAIYVFSGSGSSWTQKVELTASDGGVADYMGAASQISADGSTIVGGAWGTNSGNGGAYVFRK